MSTCFALLLLSYCHGQNLITSGSKDFNKAFFKSRSVFQKLTWLDKDGKMVGMATLHCITRIDSAGGKLIYLQLRSDGKKDSTIVDWPSLHPLYTSSSVSGTSTVYDHRHQDVEGCFDDYMGDNLLGAIPLRPGYRCKFHVCGQDISTVTIDDVYKDVLPSGNGQPLAVYIVRVNYSGFETLYWIDPANGDLLKSVYTYKDGSVFMKSKI